MVDNPLNTLLEILRDRDVPYNHDAIKAAFDSPGSQTAIQAWMEEYLSPATLLTKEEVTLYNELVKSGEADTIAATQDLSVLRNFSDKEIEEAVEELKRSTAVIEKQTEVLRLQQNAMSTLVKNNTRNNQARSQTERTQQRKWNVEKGHISAAVEELTQNLKYQTTDFEQQSKASESIVKQIIESILKSDDKLLLSLQKLASDLEPQHEDDGVMTHIRELCARLIKHTVEGIRAKLDRIYLGVLTDSKNTDGSEDSQDSTELQEELESLYSEILPVAQMSAEQQFLQPALREIRARDGQGKERSIKAVNYINDCLTFLINRLEVFLERTEVHQSHQMAMHCVLEAAKKELLRPEPSSPSKMASPVKSNTQRRRKSSSSKSPVQVRTVRRRSSANEDEIEPEQQLMRNLGVTLPVEVISEQNCIEIFERALADRLAKLEGHTATLQRTTESSISSHLADAQSTLQLLQDSLLSESLYKKVHLMHPEIESSITTFEEDLKSLQEKMEGVNLHKLQTRNVNREQLIERWSR